MTAFTDDHARNLLELMRVSLRYSRVVRDTYLPDGVTRETDGDHVVSMGMVHMAMQDIFPDLMKRLDLLKVSEFITLHDAVEAYAGDTSTIGITRDGRQAKKELEYRAFLRLEKEWAVWPTLQTRLRQFEAGDSIEYRYVRTLDKIMPALTHILNNGATLKRRGMSLEDNRRSSAANEAYYVEEFAYDQPELLGVRRILASFLEEAAFGVSRNEDA